MAITNIGTLQDAAESWLERTLTDSLFLEWANDVANKLMYGVMNPDGRTWALPPLRTRAMMATTTIVTSGGSGTISASVLELARVWINATDGTGKNLTYVPLQQFRNDPDVILTGAPQKYTIDDQTIYVAPTTDTTLQVSYYATLGAFTGDSSTDAILTAHPGVYLHGVLAEALGWIQDYERQDRERAEFFSRARSLNATDRQFQHAGSLLVMRPQAVS